jgi:hypothetical protein
VSIYLCRRTNGDVSLVIGSSRLAIEELLDNAGIPDTVEIFPISRTAAVHFRLKKKIETHDTIIDCLQLDALDEQSFRWLWSAYPILCEALHNQEATVEDIAAAAQQEKNRLEIESIELPDDSTESLIQLQINMPKRLAQHYEEIANKNARKKN